MLNFIQKIVKNVDIIFAVIFIPFYLLIGSYSGNYFARIDNTILDYLQGFTNYKEKEDKISIVAIDSKSIDLIGRWPWSRDKMAELVKTLNEYYEAKVIAFDITFSEVDKNYSFLTEGVDLFKQQLGDEKNIKPETYGLVEKNFDKVLKEKNTDQIFSNELKKWDNVILGYLFMQESQILHLTQNAELTQLNSENIETGSGAIIQNQKNAAIPEASVTVIKEGNWTNKLPSAEYIEANIPIFLESPKTQVGYFTILPDSDGVVRKNNLFMVYSKNNTVYPSLDLQILRLMSKNSEGILPQVELHIDETGIQEFKMVYDNGDGDFTVKTYDVNPDGTIYINYKGKSQTYPTYSFYDVINKTLPKESLKDNVIFIGVTEIGVFDIRATPIENSFAGVEIHANVIDNLIRNDALTFKDINQWLTYAVLIFFAVTVLILNRKISFYKTLFTLILMLGLFIAGNVYTLFNYHTWLAFSPVLLFSVPEIFLISFSRYFFEQKEKFFIKNSFKRYLSPTLIEEIIKNPSLLKLGGEKRELTVFFSDIKGFTSISENMESAELIELINEYFEDMSNIILINKGTVGKYIGDGIMAFFGAPAMQPEHAMDCCITAIQIQTKLTELRKIWLEKGKPEIITRIGINTGTIIVGNMGSSLRMEYTVMGDAVNTAARLESANKMYGTSIIISEYTHKIVKDKVVVRELDNTRVVGKMQAVVLYELIGLHGQVSEDVLNDLKLYQQGLTAFREQNWDQAITLFEKSLKDRNDILLKLYVDRCINFKKTPPPEGWDGVFVMLTK